MTNNSRRTVFYTLGLVFCVTAPILIAYALGYTLNFATHAVEQTGGIFIKSRTPRISIFLNGEFIRDTSLLSGSAFLTGLRPEAYLIRLEKEGYHPWSRAVTVDPEIVTEFHSILLVPDPVIPATSTAQEIASFKTAASTTEYATLNKKKELTLKSTGAILLRHVLFFKNMPNNIYAVTEKGFLVRIDPQTKEIITIGNPGFYISKIPFKFASSNNGLVTVMDSTGGFFLVRDDTITPLEGEVKTAAFDISERKILIVRNGIIEAIWIMENTRQPFEKPGVKEIMVTSDEEILDAFWYGRDQAHVIFRTKDGIYLTELDGRGGRTAITLISDKTDSLFVPAENTNLAFFKKGKTWYKIEL